MLAIGCSSWFRCAFSRSRSQSSSCVSVEKSASTAPALDPVAMKGRFVPGDQAKAAVRGTSLSLTIVEFGAGVDGQIGQVGFKNQLLIAK